MLHDVFSQVEHVYAVLEGLLQEQDESTKSWRSVGCGAEATVWGRQ